MHQEAFERQCMAEEGRHVAATTPIRRRGLTLLTLALGTFAIGTGEFGSNGIIQLFSAGLDVSIPVATYAITAYAFGVVLGSPAIALLAARANRRTLLLGLMVLFVAGNLFSAVAPTSRC
jgi:predicted MFS family arabinose efflux permease